MYSELEKLMFTLMTSARKLHPYFQAHAMIVLMDQPLKMFLHRLDMLSRVAKWALKLFEFGLVFRL